MSTYNMNHVGSKKVSGFAIVVAFHLVLGFALVNGLSTKTRNIFPEIKDITFIPTKPKPPIIEKTEIKINIKQPTFKPFVKLEEVVVQKKTTNDTIKDFTNEEQPPVVNKGLENKNAEVSHEQATKGSVIKQAVVNFNSCSKPEYPANSVRDGETGKVGLKFLIGKDGHVLQSKIVSSSGYRDLDKAAQKGLSACQFTPGTVDGVAQESWANVDYVWNLD